MRKGGKEGVHQVGVVLPPAGRLFLAIRKVLQHLTYDWQIGVVSFPLPLFWLRDQSNHCGGAEPPPLEPAWSIASVGGTIAKLKLRAQFFESHDGHFYVAQN